MRNNECVIYVDTQQSDGASKNGCCVDVIIPERLREQATNEMDERSAAIPIADPVENAEHKEPLEEVCVLNIDNLMNAQNQMQLPKTYCTL